MVGALLHVVVDGCADLDPGPSLWCMGSLVGPTVPAVDSGWCLAVLLTAPRAGDTLGAVDRSHRRDAPRGGRARPPVEQRPRHPAHLGPCDLARATGGCSPHVLFRGLRGRQPCRPRPHRTPGWQGAVPDTGRCLRSTPSRTARHRGRVVGTWLRAEPGIRRGTGLLACGVALVCMQLATARPSSRRGWLGLLTGGGIAAAATLWLDLGGLQPAAPASTLSLACDAEEPRLCLLPESEASRNATRAALDRLSAVAAQRGTPTRMGTPSEWSAPPSRRAPTH